MKEQLTPETQLIRVQLKNGLAIFTLPADLDWSDQAKLHAAINKLVVKRA